jgi:hypothetical protein
MMKTKILLTLALLVFSCVQCTGIAHASIEVAKGDTSDVSIFGTAQMLGLGEVVSDDVKKDARGYLFLQQARLGFLGHLGDYNFYTELALGGENMTPGSANPAFTMLEYRFDVPIQEHYFVRMGQMKTPYGAEFLTPDNERLFTELSIANLGGNWGREIGLAVASQTDTYNGAIGIYTGGGEDTPSLPLHNLPEEIGSPLVIARFGFDNSGGNALTHTQAGVFDIKKNEALLYLQGMYEYDSIIGHSSVMNVKAGQAGEVYQQNLLLNPAWNPFLTVKDKATMYSLGLNGQARTKFDQTVLTGEFQVDGDGFSDNLGSLMMYTARIQGSAACKPWEFAFRVAAVAPENNMGPPGFAGTIGGAPFYEVTPAISYYHRDWSKFMLEFQGLINVPVAHEPADGSYVLSDMPSQTTYTSGTQTLPDSITRNFVPEVKLMWQIII